MVQFLPGSLLKQKRISVVKAKDLQKRMALFWYRDWSFSFSLQKLVGHIVELLDELKYEAEDILLENT